jgi:60 kDa SS-A/Ro ribonucleoprotein
LDRFLILGTEGGTYYVREQELTIRNAEAVMRCIDADGPRVVNRVVEISKAGRAPKNDPALFVLAMASGADVEITRKAALEALPRVARIGTHLFHFMEYAKHFRGRGRAFKTSLQKWYNDKDPAKLAYQVLKYRQRDGWSHADVLRLCKPKPASQAHDAIYAFATGKYAEKHVTVSDGDWPKLITDYVKLQEANHVRDVCNIIHSNSDVTWEMVPTDFLKETVVWGELLPNLPMTAMIRNLGRMTANGLLQPMSVEAELVAERLTDEVRLYRARVHPLQILSALVTYQSGSGHRGSLSWHPVREVVDALDAAFYLSFGNVEPTNKRTMLALDISGSMTWDTIAGVPGVTPRDGSAALALVTANVEPSYMVTVFSSGSGGWMSKAIRPVSLSPRQRLDDAIREINSMPAGGTDCALPMVYATENNLKIDTFVVYTDSETWAGNIHPSQALEQYRQKSGIPARLIVVGMVSNGFSIADPNDAGMLDVVGFDTATPRLISDFSVGNV